MLIEQSDKVMLVLYEVQEFLRWACSTFTFRLFLSQMMSANQSFSLGAKLY